MPDEPAWGQFRRMAQENGLHGPKALKKLVPNGGSRDEWLAVRRELAYLMSGKTPQEGLYDYFREHCIYPQLLAPKCWEGLWHSLVFRWASHHGNLYPSRLIVSSCPECAKEDIGQFGFAWYRQGHQLPGVDWCLRHSCSLYQAPTGVDLIRLTSWRSYQAPLMSAEPKPLPPFVYRYLRVLEWLRRFDNRGKWGEFEGVTNLIAFGPRKPNYDDIHAFRERIIAAAPHDWYRTHFVEPRQKQAPRISCYVGSQSPVLARQAACITNSDADVDALFSNTAVAVEARNEQMLHGCKSAGWSMVGEALPEGDS
jgi:hypothetical protein